MRNSRVRCEAIKRNIQSYTDTIVLLAMEFGIDVDPVDQNSVSRAADRLIALYDEVKDAVRCEEAAKKDYEASVGNLKARDEQFNAAESEVIKLLEAGNATDPEDFRTKGRMASAAHYVRRGSAHCAWATPETEWAGRRAQLVNQ